MQKLMRRLLPRSDLVLPTLPIGPFSRVRSRSTWLVAVSKEAGHLDVVPYYHPDP